MSLFDDLKHRKVIKVAIAYAIAAWVLIQVVDTIFPILNLPDWSVTFVTAVILIGFPLALVFAWAVELTPAEGERDKDDERVPLAPKLTRQTFVFATIGVMAVAILYLGLANYVFERPVIDHESANIVVVPFTNISQTDQYALGIGISQAVLTHLSNAGWDVRPQNEDSDAGMADYTLTGNVQESGTAVRTTVRLADSRDETVWTQSYLHTDYTDILKLQEQVSRSISNATGWEVTKTEGEKARLKPAAERDAEDNYFLAASAHGRDYWSPRALAEAGRYLDIAIELDNNYVHALSYRAGVLLSEAIVGSAISVDDHIRRADELSERAWRIEGKDEGIVWTRARALWFTGNHDRAILLLKQTLVSFDTMRLRYALALLQASNLDLREASENVQRAIDLGLEESESRYLSGMIALSEQDYEKASNFLSYGEKWPSSDGYVHTVTALYMAGRELDAVETFRRLQELFPDESIRAKMHIYRIVFPFYVDVMIESLRAVGWDGES